MVSFSPFVPFATVRVDDLSLYMRLSDGPLNRFSRFANKVKTVAELDAHSQVKEVFRFRQLLRTAVAHSTSGTGDLLFS